MGLDAKPPATATSASRCVAARMHASSAGGGFTSMTSSCPDRLVRLRAQPACPCADRLAIDASRGQRPGVLLTLTADDWDRAGHGELTVVHPMPFGDGRPMNAAPRPAFARGKVRHVGDIVAAVVADTRFAAEDAVEAVEVAYDPLPA